MKYLPKLLLLLSIIGGITYAHYHPYMAVKRDTVYTEALPSQNQEKIKKLEIFLSEKKSPLASYSAEFIKTAEAYRIDPAITVGIAGSESTFARNYDPDTFNVWGWGYCDSCDDGIYFDSFEHGIREVTKGIATNKPYRKFQQTKDIRDLANTYMSGCLNKETGENPCKERWINLIKNVQKELEI